MPEERPALMTHSATTHSFVPHRRLRAALAALGLSITGLAACGSDAGDPARTDPTTPSSSTTGNTTGHTTPPTDSVVVVQTGGVPGRPLRRRGRLLVGRSRRRLRWIGRRAGRRDVGLARRQRRSLAAHWRRVAELEHASVVAFEHLGAQLESVGAPDTLVVRCSVAAAQERVHADHCFALASRYAGAEVRPGRLDAPALGEPTLVEIAVESLRDGALNEGYAAWIAEQQLLACSDADVAATLRIVARDEVAHAALSWAVLEWCLGVGGDSVAQALRAASARLPRLAMSDRENDPVLAAHGMAVVDRGGSAYESLRQRTETRVLDLLASSDTRIARVATPS
jgi:hypothetical protein